MNQIPYVLTFATTKPSKKQSLAGKEVEYRQLKEELFFGYKLIDGIYIAEPEKAVLDQLYLISKGKVASETNEWSLAGLNKEKLADYSKKFPQAVQKRVAILEDLAPRLKQKLKKEISPSPN